MNIRINSFNSQDYSKNVYIDCSEKEVQEFMNRAININIDLKLENYECNVQWEGQKTSITLMQPTYLKIISSPRTVSLLYGRDKFLPGKTIVFRPYSPSP